MRRGACAAGSRAAIHPWCWCSSIQRGPSGHYYQRCCVACPWTCRATEWAMRPGRAQQRSRGMRGCRGRERPNRLTAGPEHMRGGRVEGQVTQIASYRPKDGLLAARSRAPARARDSRRRAVYTQYVRRREKNKAKRISSVDGFESSPAFEVFLAGGDVCLATSYARPNCISKIIISRCAADSSHCETCLQFPWFAPYLSPPSVWTCADHPSALVTGLTTDGYFLNVLRPPCCHPLPSHTSLLRCSVETSSRSRHGRIAPPG